MWLEQPAGVLAEHGGVGKLPEWHEWAVQSLQVRARRGPPSTALSDAERKVLRLLASDLSLREIGRALYLSSNTTKSHVHSIYRNLGVSSRTDAISAARTQERARRPDYPVSVRTALPSHPVATHRFVRDPPPPTRSPHAAETINRTSRTAARVNAIADREADGGRTGRDRPANCGMNSRRRREQQCRDPTTAPGPHGSSVRGGHVRGRGLRPGRR